MGSRLVCINTCRNELPYLKNQIPQFLECFDKIHIIDDFSTDGTTEWIESLRSDKIDFFQRKFDQCSNQFDAVLQRCDKDNTWVWCATADELPTKHYFKNIRKCLASADEEKIDRIWSTVYHLRGEREMSSEIGDEIRLFRNDAHHGCYYCDYPHERLHGNFDGHCGHYKSEDGIPLAFVHFKQCDPTKLHEWKTEYVEKGIYSLWDVNRRLNFPTVILPEIVEYKVSEDFRRFLKWSQ